MKTTRFLGMVSAVGVALLLTASLAKSQPDRNFGSVHLIMGNPSGATQDASNADNFLMIKPQYALSYNKSKSIANWVSWQLNQKWIGSTPRCKGLGGQEGFAPDKTLPQGFKPVMPTDYQGIGFDRGHMTPSADRTANKTDNCATFLMTNIIPQSPDVNQGPWETLESYSRSLASEQGKELYIISGGAGTGGEGRSGSKPSFKGKSSGNTITVPASSWKVIVVLEKPGLGLSGITQNTRVIAVNMPHKQGVKGELWDVKVSGKPKYITSAKEIEKLTGYDFLSNVPKDIQDSIEAKVDKGS